MSAVGREETGQVLAPTGARQPLAVPRRLLRMRSDAALAERFAAGDESAFDVIYERHRPVVLAVCMGVLGTPPDAEDATQETFSALAVALRTRPPAELRPWLIRVARNASIDTTRRRRHRLLTLDGEIPEVAARPAGSGRAELAVVLDGIRELPEGQRMALLMRELGGHSYAEIADFLATDEEAVKGLIARARVGLRTYREATELSCASARGTIAAEPDGRRYDKTIRRHLRGCSSCRAYREALRDDARALRSALPIQAGTVATGSLTSGMLTAAKGSLLGYGLTQAATTCAASACAVGALGGMVFVAPVHRLGLPPILAPVSTLHGARHAPAARPHAHHHRLVAEHADTSYHQGATPEPAGAATPAAPAGTHRAPAPDSRPVHVTRVVLPGLPGRHGRGHGNPGHGHGHAYGSWKTQAPPSAQSSPDIQSAAGGPATGAPTGSGQGSAAPAAPGNSGHLPGNGHGVGNGNGNGHGRRGAGQAGNQHWVGPTASVASVGAASASAGQSAASVAGTTASAAGTTGSGTAGSGTVSPSAPPTATAGPRTTGNPNGHGHGRGRGNARATAYQPSAAQSGAGSAQGNAGPTITIDFGSGGSNGNGHGWGHNR